MVTNRPLSYAVHILGTFCPYTDAMNAPAPLGTPSRLNVGGYEVRVRFEYRKPGVSKVIDKLGDVYPDGSLSIFSPPWADRHYRRAVMRGAGVYQAGLWAMLAGRAQVIEAEAGADGDGGDWSGEIVFTT